MVADQKINVIASEFSREFYLAAYPAVADAGRNSMVQTHAFIRERKLVAADVGRINRIIRARARQYIAAGRKEWPHPDQSEGWGDLRHVLLPPKKELYRYGG
jgi:hypothetical protein